MKRPLSEYQRLLERFENFNDGFILPDLFLVMRIDARRFGEEWRAVPDGEYPFGAAVYRAFLATTQRLMCAGFRVVYALASGDEVSLFFDPLESANQRRRSKFISIVSSIGAVAFLQASSMPVLFHAKLSELPSLDHVRDYFLWQKKVSTRNFCSRTFGQILAAQGRTPTEINQEIGGLTEEQFRAYGETLGVALAESAPWKRLGTAFWWERVEGDLRLFYCQDLPEDDVLYSEFLAERLRGESVSTEELFPLNRAGGVSHGSGERSSVAALPRNELEKGREGQPFRIPSLRGAIPRASAVRKRGVL